MPNTITNLPRLFVIWSILILVTFLIAPIKTFNAIAAVIAVKNELGEIADAIFDAPAKANIITEITPADIAAVSISIPCILPSALTSKLTATAITISIFDPSDNFGTNLPMIAAKPNIENISPPRTIKFLSNDALSNFSIFWRVFTRIYKEAANASIDLYDPEKAPNLLAAPKAKLKRVNPPAKAPRATPALINSPVLTLLNAINDAAKIATDTAILRIALDFISSASALTLVAKASITPSNDFNTSLIVSNGFRNSLTTSTNFLQT